MRLIDADALEQDGWCMNRIVQIDEKTMEYQTRKPTDFPAIEPKKGRWIEYDNSHCECPFCHEEWSYFDNEVEHFNYCPNCGADMREGDTP